MKSRFFFLFVVFVPSTVSATEVASTAEDTVTPLSEFIRWGGVLTSVAVLFGAWLFLRFMRESIAKIGKQFAGRRLLLQKIATLIQFAVYVATGAIVVTLSVRLDDRVLAVIGGTLAVAVGFAIKDLVASFIAGIMIMNRSSVPSRRPRHLWRRVRGHHGDWTPFGTHANPR